MSAIAGIIQRTNQPLNKNDLHNFNQLMNKYKVNKSSMWKTERVYLSCHMHWITPESVQEELPFYDKEAGLVITADAIIDNRDELFDVIGIDTFKRENMSDSQLILQAFKKWGKNAPSHLIGDFSFMIWDERNRELFGARDLLGTRNLYYSEEADNFAFCTAIAPLLELCGRKRELNEVWLSEFLAIPSFIETIDPHQTVYNKVLQLPPGHSICLSESGGGIVSSYGSLIPSGTLHLKNSDDYLEAFQEVFHAAINSRLRSMRPISATLSGGLDSSSIVSVAAKSLLERGERLRTYSMIPVKGFEDWTSKSEIADESEYIQATVDYVGNINSKFLSSPGKSPLSEIDEMLAILEMPYKNFENTFRIKEVYEKASEDGAGILLTGAKGNFTISWGSAIEYYSLLFKKMRWLSFYQELNLFSKQAGVGRKRLLSTIKRHAFPSGDMVSLQGKSDVPSLISPDFAKRMNVMDRLQNENVGINHYRNDVLKERQNYFQDLGALNLQGTFASKMSLHHGVWERDPTSDARLVRFCLSLPFQQFVYGGIGRSLIRRSTKGELPDKVRLNQRIRGIQGVDWVQRMIPQWKSFLIELHQMCKDSSMNDYMDTSSIQIAIEKVGKSPSPDQVGDPNIKYLMRSLIMYRFLKTFN